MYTHSFAYEQCLSFSPSPPGESASESFSQPSSQQQQEAETSAVDGKESTSLVERGETSQSKPQDDGSSPHRTGVGSESSSRTDRTQTSNTSSRSSGGAHSEFSNIIAPSTTPTSDEAISGTLSEVLSNIHSREQDSTGLGNTAPARLRVVGGVTTHEDDVHVAGDGNTIVVTSEESRHNEVEVRTNDKSMTTAESDESFIVQGCTDAVERTTSESPQSATNKTGQTSASSSPSSSRDPQQASSKLTSRRRGGSAGPRSRRSESRASSVGSEAGGDEGGEGEGEKETARTPTRGKRRQKVHCMVTPSCEDEVDT